MAKYIDVHTEHCCLVHGCKYGNAYKCTVMSCREKQSYPCEDCIEEKAQGLFETQSHLRRVLGALGIKSWMYVGPSDFVRKFSMEGPYEYEKRYNKKSSLERKWQK